MLVVGDDHFDFSVPLLLTMVAKAGGFLSPSSMPAASGLRCMAEVIPLHGGSRCRPWRRLLLAYIGLTPVVFAMEYIILYPK
jgi:hypothetical protein